MKRLNRLKKLIIGALTIGPMMWANLPVAHAEDRQPPAEVTTTPVGIMEKAKLGRLEFSDTMYELKEYFYTLSNKSDMIPFMLILDSLEKLETNLQFSIYDQSPLRETAGAMATRAQEYANLSTDSVEFLRAIMKWIPEDAALVFFQNQRKVMDPISQLDSLNTAFANMGDLVKYLMEKESVSGSDSEFQNHSIFITHEGSVLLGSILERIHRLYGNQLSTADYEAYLQRLPNRVSIDAFIHALHVQVLATKDPSQFDYILRLAPALFARFKVLETNISTELENPVGEIVTSGIGKIMFANDPMDETLLAGAIKTLNAQQVLSLGGRLTNLEPSVYPSVRIEMISVLGNLLVERYQDYNLKYELVDLKRNLERLNRLALLNANSFEGIYTIKGQNIEKGVLTILRYGPYDVGATLNLNNETLNFLEARYNQRTLTWEFYIEKCLAGGDELCSKSGRRLSVKFNEAGQSLTAALFINESSSPLSGEMYRSAISMNRTESPKPPRSEEILTAPLGVFNGDFTDSAHNVMKGSLSLQDNGKDSFSAILTFKRSGSPIRVALSVSWFDAATGSMILTPKIKITEAPITQLRLHHSQNHLSGQYFVGGQQEPYLVNLERSE